MHCEGGEITPMADEEHWNIIKQGTQAWNDWRRANPEIRPDLTGVSLSGRDLGNLRLSNVDMNLCTLKRANLRGSDFWRTDLNLSDMSGANLSRSYFGRSHLHTANLSGADLANVRFIGADLSGANLSNTRIFHTHFIDSDLSAADFSHAWINEAAFANVDLSKAIGLETVHFIGPSTLGIDSIYRSSGLIPTAFLRGCGVPEEFIRLIPTLSFTSPLQCTCYLGFNSMDRVFCEKLYGDMQANGVRCWLLPDDKGSGIRPQMDDVAHVYHKLVAICSRNSMRSSGFTDQLVQALEVEQHERRNVLFCITRDDALAQDWTHPQKELVQATVVADFRHWEKPESYERGLEKVLRALNQK